MSFGEHHIAFGGNGTQQMSTHTPHTNLQAGIWLLIKCTWLSNNQQVWATQKKKFGQFADLDHSGVFKQYHNFPRRPNKFIPNDNDKKNCKKEKKTTNWQAGSVANQMHLINWLSTSASSSMKADVWAVCWYATFRELGLVLQTWAPWSHWVNHELVCKSILDSNVRSSAWQLKHGWYWVVPWPYLRTNNSQSAKVQ